MSRVLVIDDDRGAAEALSRLLRLDGHEAVGFASPAEARVAIEHEPFDAVITDLEMPRVHGVDIVRTARRVHAGAPVFVITGYGNTAAERTARDSGASAVFGKPINYDELLAALNTALARGRTQR